MGLSKQSESEILNLGTPKEKVGGFRYWVDLNKFRTKNKEQRTRDRVKLGWMKKFMVLYVGRLVEEKGILVLLDAASRWNKKITLAIAGSGPLEKEINHRLSTINHSVLLGKIDNDNLPKYYNAADLVIVPSIHEEGFGRVILEALASGTPVIGANRGAIPEAMNENVGRLIEVTSENIKVAVEDLYNNRAKLKKLSSRTRKFAEKRYSEKNVEDIITTFE
jgi:glycosyltransferase involved in cell wall biosynthesis